MTHDSAEIIPFGDGCEAAFTKDDRIWFFNATGTRVDAVFKERDGARARIVIPDAAGGGLDIEHVISFDRIRLAKPVAEKRAPIPPDTDEMRITPQDVRDHFGPYDGGAA